MREPGVVRLLGEQRFEDRHRLQLAGVCLVVQILGRAQGQRVEDRRFGIVPVPAGDARHGVAVGLESPLLRHAVGVHVQLRGSVDVVTLAIGLRPDRPRPLDRAQPLPKLGRRASAHGERVAPAAQRNPPLRHRARGVGGERRVERLDRGAELERVEQGHRTVECRLRARGTRSGEMDRPQLLTRQARVLVLLRSDRAAEENDEQNQRTGHS